MCYCDSESFFWAIQEQRQMGDTRIQLGTAPDSKKLRSKTEQLLSSQAGRGKAGFQGQHCWLLPLFQRSNAKVMLSCTAQMPEIPTRVTLCCTQIVSDGPTSEKFPGKSRLWQANKSIWFSGKRQWKGGCAYGRVKTRGWGTGDSHRNSVISAAVTLDSACMYFVLVALLRNGVYICLSAPIASWPLWR